MNQRNTGDTLGANVGYGNVGLNSLQNAAGMPQKQPASDQSPVSQSMGRLFNTITCARAELQMLAAQLKPVLPLHGPEHEKLEKVEPDPTCPIDAELHEYQRLAQDIVDLVRLLQSELRI